MVVWVEASVDEKPLSWYWQSKYGILGKSVLVSFGPHPERQSVRQLAFGDYARLLPASVVGLIAAVNVALVVTAPLLLVKPPWAQSVAIGICSAFGYGFGALLGSIVYWIARALALQVVVEKRVLRLLAWIVSAGLLALATWGFVMNYRAAIKTASLTGMEKPSVIIYLLELALGAALAWGILQLISLVHQLTVKLIKSFGSRLPLPLARLAGWVLVITVVALVLYGGVIRGGLGWASKQAAELNKQTYPNASRPTSELVSGSVTSNEDWNLLGKEGRAYVAHTPSKSEISKLTKLPATQPIRAYASVAQHKNVAETARAVVAELERTGAFERPVLAVITTTGTGWVNSWNPGAFEYVTGGNCATAAMQYSYNPSWVQILANKDEVKRAGTTLVRAVLEKVPTLPKDKRPKVYLSGESLGAYSGLAALTELSKTAHGRHLVSLVSGQLWAGTPAFTPERVNLERARTHGSPQIAPVIDNGRHIRVVTSHGELATDIYGRELGRWSYPRTIYAQHASDPVTRWELPIWTAEPDWMREDAGHDVDSHLRWHWFVTFTQLSAELPLAIETEPGHGHNYQGEYLAYWRSLLGLPGAIGATTSPLTQEGSVGRAIGQGGATDKQILDALRAN